MIIHFVNHLISWLLSPNALLLLLFVLLLAYRVGTYNHDFFSRNGIPTLRPLPFLGNAGSWVFGKVSFFDKFQELYRHFAGHKVFGIFDFMGPVYVIRDYDLVKQICIKDFDSFTDRRHQFNEDADSLFANALFALRGTRWRNMRAILSPAFTGSKMRGMFGLMTEYYQKANQTLEEMIGSEKVKEVEIRDILNKMSCDIVASCAFGLEMNVLRDGENDFFRQAKHMTHLSTWQWFKFMIFSSFPWLAKTAGLRIFDPISTDFMRNSVRAIIEHREQNNIVRNDMVHLLMQARDQKLKFEDTDKKLNNMGLSTAHDYPMEDAGKIPDWTLDDFVSQCAIFIFGGLDTVTNIASFMAHELALNPSVQATLRNEIDQALRDTEGNAFSYENLQSLAYMDRVVTETLRKWPQALFIDRVCTKAYNLKIDDKVVPLNRGDALWMPALPLQRDPRFFPKPEEFDPDRFAPERRDHLESFVHLSFGVGPRNCLGNRFALMQIKTVFFWLLSRFEITRSVKTSDPLELGKSFIIPEVKSGFYVNLKKRC